MTTAPDVPAVAPPLEGTLWSAVVAELRRVFRWPADTPLILAANGAVMCIGWFYLPDSLRDWFFSMHGPLAFPIVLESWMISDVPATNVLGGDAKAALAALSNPRAFQRFLYAKSLAIWLLVAPLCAVIAFVIGLNQHHHVSSTAICVLVLILPFGVLGISSWLGIVLPYHPRSLRWRWEHRHERRSMIRWIVLMVAPYSFVPAVTGLVVLPSILLTRRGSQSPTHLLTQGSLTVAAAIAALSSGLALLLGHAIGARLADRRSASLVSYLTDPERG